MTLQNRPRKFLALALLLSFLGACQGSGTRARNPKAPEGAAALQVNGTTESTTTASSSFQNLLEGIWSVFSPLHRALASQQEGELRDLNGNQIEIHEAFVFFEALKITDLPMLSQLDAQGNPKPRNIDASSRQATLDSQGPFLVDLLDENPETLTGITLPTGGIGGAHLKQANPALLNDGIRYVPNGMEGFSMMIRGKLDSNSTFEFFTTEDFVSASKIEVSNELGPDGLPIVKFEINLRQLMGQIIVNVNEALAQGGCPTLAPGVKNQGSCFLLSAEKSSSFAHP